MIKKFDIYADTLKLNFNKKNAEGTIIGGCLTILTILIGISFTWFIGKDIYYKQNPYSYQEKVIYDETYPLIINRTSFPFFFSIQNLEGKPLYDERYLKLTINYTTFISSQDYEYNQLIQRELKFKKAESKDFPQLDSTHFNKNSLGKFYTIEEENLNLTGTWSEYQIKRLDLIVSECDSQSFCASKEEIDSYITKNNINFNLYYFDYQVKPNNYSHPTPTFIASSYKFLSLKEIKIVNFNLQKDVIETDSGYFFEDKSNLEYIKLTETYSDTSLTSEKFGNFKMNFMIYSSNISNFTYRKYVKLPEIIASVCGILDILFLVFQFINSPFCDINRYCTVIDLLFRSDYLGDDEKFFRKNNFYFKNENLKNLNLIKNRQKIINLYDNKISHELNKSKKSSEKSLHTKENISILDKEYLAYKNIKNNFSFQNHLNKNFKKYIETSILRKNMTTSLSQKYQSSNLTSNLTNFEKIKIICSRLRHKKSESNKKNNITNIKLYETALPYVENLFDYLKVIKSIQEFEFFKKIYFNESQQKLFSQIKVKLDSNLKEENFYSTHATNFYHINENNFEPYSDIDKKLLKFMK
jgi:hypothetical protein